MDSSERENGGSSDEQNNTGDEDKNDLDSSGDAEEIKRRRIQQSPSKKGFMVSASPPTFVSFDQLMSAANGVSNMALAHEIVLDHDFKLEKLEPPAHGLEKQVKEIVHRAFWDTLQAKLTSDPPDYTPAIVLMGEVKEALGSILLPQHERLRQHIGEVLDLELIQQKADNGVLDVQYYAEFVISIMAKLCAPVRDERIAKIIEIKEIVPLYREIFAVLDLVKMDMANFTIQQIRPYLQQQSVDYEKKKFKEFLEAQKEAHIDGLEQTKYWLTGAYEKLQEAQTEGPVASTSQGNPSMATPATILNHAYLELLHWDSIEAFPETVLMDQQRFMDLGEKLQKVTLISSILLVTYNTVGAPIAGIPGFKDKLKQNISVLLQDVNMSDLGDVLSNVAEQVSKEVSECLVNHGFSVLDDHQRSVLKGQIIEVESEEHTVHKLIDKRVNDFVLLSITSPMRSPVKIPAGLSAMEKELSEICGRFLRLIAHNRAVFGLYYAEIIGSLVLPRQVDASVTDTMDN